MSDIGLGVVSWWVDDSLSSDLQKRTCLFNCCTVPKLRHHSKSHCTGRYTHKSRGFSLNLSSLKTVLPCWVFHCHLASLEGSLIRTGVEGLVLSCCWFSLSVPNTFRWNPLFWLSLSGLTLSFLPHFILPVSLLLSLSSLSPSLSCFQLSFFYSVLLHSFLAHSIKSLTNNPSVDFKHLFQKHHKYSVPA